MQSHRAAMIDAGFLSSGILRVFFKYCDEFYLKWLTVGVL
jgi:hypothetical protein